MYRLCHLKYKCSVFLVLRFSFKSVPLKDGRVRVLQLTTRSMNSSSQEELENRLHSLTESLIQKQTMLEALSTEKNSLVLQLERLEVRYVECSHFFTMGSHNNRTLERGSSVVESRTRNRESPGSNPPFATVSKFGHFRSLHDASVHSAV